MDNAEAAAEIIRLRARIADLERQFAAAPLLTVVMDADDKMRVIQAWPNTWGVEHFAPMLALVILHVAHNADLELHDLVPAIEAAMDQIELTDIEGGRVM